MTKKWLVPVLLSVVVIVSAALVGRRLLDQNGGFFANGNEPTETVTWTEYLPPALEAESLAEDDRLRDKQTTFDPDLFDRRPEGDWLINQSAAVIRLDVPIIKPDLEPALLVLHPSYAAAMASKANLSEKLLPSVNLIDGKAKQFDDGLVAALEQAIFQGKTSTLPDPISVVKRLADVVAPDSPAAAFLAAGLSLVGETIKIAPALDAEKSRWLADFHANEVRSKPIGFYTWNPTLSNGFRFHRFFQQEFSQRTLAIPRALGKILAHDQALREAYRRAVKFDERLTNRPACLSLNDLADDDRPLGDDQSVAVFPASTSREGELFARLFPQGLPEGADLMGSLLQRIRSGEIDLSPRKESGWYEQQVHALETLLLPEKGAESPKLFLSKSYKLRMLEAFKALITKRRETHVMNAKTAATAPAPVPLKLVVPRLRVEPCPSFYLRTARAYAFLDAFLESFVGAETLRSLHGLRESGERPLDLRTELAMIRDLFYGIALLSFEGIGARPSLHDDEPIDREHCERLASEWLEHFKDDPDLGIDTRVSVPVYSDARATRLWATLGVRMTRLEVSFLRGPKVKPRAADPPNHWEDVDPDRLGSTNYLIPVDEFAEVALRGQRVLTRKELRAICDSETSKSAILSALQR